jgi:hypothetical protein
MCMFCGGQRGEIGEILITLGVPWPASFLFKLKQRWAKIKDHS